MSPQPSSGIVTVLFTDVEASTDITTRLGDDVAGPLLATCQRLVREQIVAHGGRRLESTGDGFLALFDSTRRAVACALSIERELGAREDGVRVRIGINAGEVLEGDEALFGAAINLTKRVMDRARGGEILVTDTVRQLAGTVPDARFRDRGRVALKGFPERQHLHELRAAGARPPPRAPPSRSKRPILAASAVAVAAIVATAVVLASAGGEEPVDVHPNSVAIIDAKEGRVVGQVPVGLRPTNVVAGAGSVWVANDADDTVTQIEASSRRFAGTVTPGISVDGLAAGPSGIWVGDTTRAAARVIDPGFGSVARVPIGEPLSPPPVGTMSMAVTADAVWTTYGYSKLARLAPRHRGRRVATIQVGNAPSGVAAGEGAVWVSDQEDGTVTRIDPRTNDTVETIAVGASASGIAAGSGGVWVAVPLEDRVKRIDPATNSVVDTVPVGGGPASVAIGAGAVWVTSRRGGTVTRIDPDAAHVTRTIRLGHSPQGVAVVEDEVWVAVQASPAPASPPGDERARDVLTVSQAGGVFGGADPAQASGGWLYATCAMLLNYPDAPFPAGSRLQPEVARAMPAVSDGGRTYTFHVRPGFRFSPPSGEPVTAAAFRRALERGLNPRTESYAAVTMGDIAGAEAFSAGRSKRLKGVTARGDTLTIRLEAPSATLPSRIASTYYCAVPPSTPISAKGLERVPTAGPYYVASYVPDRRLVLRRNPNYRGERPARMREIDIDLDVSRRRAVNAVAAGRADYAPFVPIDDVPALERRYGPGSPAGQAGRQRYFSAATPFLHFFVFNNRRPLFASQRLRQAVNEALDRRALARSVHNGGSTPGRATDQFIAPGQPGFHDATIYPLGGPDLERARMLAGDRHRHAVLYTCNLPHCREHGQVLRRNLAAIGIDLEIENFTLDEMFTREQDPTEPWDIAYTNWFIDYADPAQYIAPLFDPPDSQPDVINLKDAALRHRIRAATRLGDAARTAAFEQLDADLTRAAAAAPFATTLSTDFFSDRIGCQLIHPIYGISLGSLCVRK